jgi:hypothetical protein
LLHEPANTVDVFVGIYGWRYGNVPSGEEKSIIHQQFEEAARREPRVRLLLFLADESTEADTSERSLFPAGVRDPKHHADVTAFRQQIQSSHAVEYFTTPQDLAVKVESALQRYAAHERWSAYWSGSGWSPPRPVLPVAPTFVGRTREALSLAQQLRQGTGAIVAPVPNNVQGIGASALACHVVNQLVAEPDLFPAGVAWVHCSEQRGIEGLIWVYDQVLAEWRADLTIRERNSAATAEAAAALREQALRRIFSLPQPASSPIPSESSIAGNHSGTALLVLDGVENEFPLNRLLQVMTAVGGTLLLTMDWNPGVAALPVLLVDVLDPAAAQTLFAERYRQAWPDPSEDLASVLGRSACESVVHLLGHSPLAIELAAASCARARQTPADFAKELSEANLEAMGGSARNLRDHTLAYLFRKCLATLTDSQRLRVAALGLLPGTDWPAVLVEDFLGRIQLTDAHHTDVADETTCPAADDLSLLSTLAFVRIGSAGDREPETDTPENGKREDPAYEARVFQHSALHALARDYWVRLVAQPGHPQEMMVLQALEAVRNFLRRYRGRFSVLEREENLLAGVILKASSLPKPHSECISAINLLANYVRIAGHWQLGDVLFTRQLAIRRQIGDRQGEGVTLNNLGLLADKLGRHAQARDY